MSHTAVAVDHNPNLHDDLENRLPIFGEKDPLPSGLSIQEMLSESDLDWSVKLSKGLSFDGIDTSSHNVLYRTDTDKLLTIVPKNWKPQQNADIVGLFDKWVRKAGSEIEYLGSLDGGRTML
jgi:hypothetical protein